MASQKGRPIVVAADLQLGGISQSSPGLCLQFQRMERKLKPLGRKLRPVRIFSNWFIYNLASVSREEKSCIVRELRGQRNKGLLVQGSPVQYFNISQGDKSQCNSMS